MNNTQQSPLNPMLEKPAYLDQYWVPNIRTLDLASRITWCNDDFDHLMFDRCICFATREEAAECARRMLAAIKVEIAP